MNWEGPCEFVPANLLAFANLEGEAQRGVASVKVT